MYNLLTTSGQTCAQTMYSYSGFIFNNSTVYKTPYLYQLCGQLIHSSFPNFVGTFNQLWLVCTLYTHSLLLKLLIYLKKGY
jgi:hypothetical protein